MSKGKLISFTAFHANSDPMFQMIFLVELLMKVFLPQSEITGKVKLFGWWSLTFSFCS
jgi:hypothetical protein